MRVAFVKKKEEGEKLVTAAAVPFRLLFFLENSYYPCE